VHLPNSMLLMCVAKRRRVEVSRCACVEVEVVVWRMDVEGGEGMQRRRQERLGDCLTLVCARCAMTWAKWAIAPLPFHSVQLCCRTRDEAAPAKKNA